MEYFLVTHTHWDREWYRTFQSFRARLVDTVDRVLELIDADPGFRFLLDGQTVVLEDYLEVRPRRRADIERACREGRLGIGPWYVQPDSLLPSGEAHVRNLLEGRLGGAAFGPLSRTAYTPDSFGHPAQFPQLFRGFGLGPFVYWRGNGSEIEQLPAEYVWEAPDGSAVVAHHLGEGYFAAAGLPADPEAAADCLQRIAAKLAERARDGRVLLMNGIDHAMPGAHTAAVADVLARRGWEVRRALLDDFATGLAEALGADPPRFRGALLGGRVANLLPGVWSTRTPLKLRNRRAETLLQSWAEPFSALGAWLGCADERPALREAWRELLKNQAHDSICGCSQDRVHEQMQARYDAAEELAAETTNRVLERLAGLGPERRTPWTDEFDLAVFNPSPHAQTGVVRFALEPDAWFEMRGGIGGEFAVHPMLRLALAAEGFTADGRPARLLAEATAPRVRLLPDCPPRSVEFVVDDVPAFGWKRVRLRSSAPHPDQEDDGSEIESGGIAVRAAGDGTFTVRFGERLYSGLCGLEDVGDRGDTYDFDPVPGGVWSVERVRVRRRTHAGGIRALIVERDVRVPAALSPERDRRSAGCVTLRVETEARLADGVPRVDLRVVVENTARDHRLRLLFPTGAPASEFLAATTFDVARVSTETANDAGWKHPAPRTFPHQGFVFANGLTVVAPGLPEVEVGADGVVAVTLVRAVGWLAHLDLRTRPEPAGPMLPTPGAQCLGRIEAQMALFAGFDPRAASDFEAGLRGVVAGSDAEALLPAGQPLVEVSPASVLLSALKPAQQGDGIVLRLLNPTDAGVAARVRVGAPVASAVGVRLDETADGSAVRLENGELSLEIPAHGLRSVLLARVKDAAPQP